MTTVAKLEKLQLQAKNLAARIDETKAAIKAAGCSHPESHVYSFEVDCDNGYGEWWKVKKKTCQICGAFYTYGNWSR